MDVELIGALADRIGHQHLITSSFFIDRDHVLAGALCRIRPEADAVLSAASQGFRPGKKKGIDDFRRCRFHFLNIAGSTGKARNRNNYANYCDNQQQFRKSKPLAS